MYNRISTKPKYQLIILLVLGMVFFFIYSFLIFNNPQTRFTWPDETANHYFIIHYIEQSNFFSSQPVNEIAGNLLKPRSFNIYQHNLVPGSFLGMLLLYGLVGKIVGAKLILFLTPFLSAIAGIFFYGIVLKIFKPQVAFLSAILFFINPAWWYYASLTMLPNISFICFLLIGFYLILNLGQQRASKNLAFLLGAGFFIGLALIIRTNELVWVVAILIILAAIYYKKIRWYYPLLFLLVVALVFGPILYYNQQTYGSALSFGYLRLDQGRDLVSQLPSEFAVSHSQWLNFVKFVILPFGFHPAAVMNNFYNYFIALFWLIFALASLGLFSLIKNYNKSTKAVYLLIVFCLGIYLTVYYGSWVFADAMTVKLNRLGLSYVRYWLPLYILIIPLVVVFLLDFISWFKNKKLRILLALLGCLSILSFSANLVYFLGNDNLLALKKNISDYNQINQQVVSRTEDNAIIISQRSDKIFFPERQVISQWQAADLVYWQVLLSAGYPLYYYAYEGNDFIRQMNLEIWQAGYSFELSDKIMITDKESLYKIKPIIYEEIN